MVQNTIKENLAWSLENDILIELCHVPSHCGVVGNEHADLAANRGSKMTEEVIPYFNNISRTEGYRLIMEAAKKDRVNFPTLASDNFSKKGIFPTGVSHFSIGIYRRLKLNNPWFKYVSCISNTIKCPHCHSDLEIDHLTVNACQPLKNEFGFIHSTLVSNNTDVHDLLKLTTPANWSDALYMCDVFRKSSVGHLL